MSERKEPTTRADYRVFRPLPTRWMDNDIYGHLNNVVHYSLFDTAVNGWLVEKGLLDPHRDPIISMVVETGCRYRGEMAFPDLVTAGLAAARIGNSSIRYHIGLFRNEDTAASAEGHFTHVYVDRATRRPVPIPERLRAAFTSIAL